jgi:hypothetical protein
MSRTATSGGVCDGHRLPLNWAIAQPDSYRHLTTLRRMAPENGSPGPEVSSPSVNPELTAGHLFVCRLLVDVVVAHGKPCQQRLAVGVGADGEQGPAVRTRETPSQ